MKSHSNTFEHKVPLAQLTIKLLELVAQTPSTMDELAILVGYSKDVVRMRLLRMEEADCVRREQRLPPRGWGMHYVWHATGVPLVSLGGEPGGNLKRDGIPYQVTVKAYPTIGRRDPLVASLFGPARTEAA